MNKKLAVRLVVGICLLAAALSVAHAVVYDPVRITAYRFKTGATFTYIDLVFSNPNPVSIDGTGVIQVALPSGITRQLQFVVNGIPPGNANARVNLPFEIASVRFVRLTHITN